VELGLIDAAEVQVIHAEVEEEIKAGLDYAQNSPAPDIAELTRYVYTENGGNDHE
jgi:pyruvate dehydrogenase E1 component alpha subunit